MAPGQMRCWRTREGTTLVESPAVPRMTGRDPVTHRDASCLLREARAWLARSGLAAALEGFARYYEVDGKGRVVTPYEEYSFSCEDDLHTWGYRVLGDQLWEFALTRDGADSTLRVRALRGGLAAAALPGGVVILAGGGATR